MRLSARPPLVLTVLVLLGTGCQTAGYRFLSLIGLQRQPLSVALVMDKPVEAAAAFNPFPAYGPLQLELSKELARSVAVDVCFPFQVEGGLSGGWYDLAVLSPVQYAGLPHAADARVVVVSVDKEGKTASSALLVVPAKSELQTIGDLRGKIVAFGPFGDVRMHHAALRLLEEAGLQPSDLALELLPVPGSLRHLSDGRAVVQSVLSGESAAGFVDEATWDSLAEMGSGDAAQASISAGHAAGGAAHDARGAVQGNTSDEPSRDGLRVLARTLAVPNRIMLASPKMDAATFAHIRNFALAVGTEHPEVMAPLTSSGYALPTDELLATCRRLAPPPATEPTGNQPATSQPATTPP